MRNKKIALIAYICITGILMVGFVVRGIKIYKMEKDP